MSIKIKNGIRTGFDPKEHLAETAKEREWAENVWGHCRNRPPHLVEDTTNLVTKLRTDSKVRELTPNPYAPYENLPRKFTILG